MIKRNTVPSKATLEQQYVVEQLSQVQIGKLHLVSSTTVRGWLRKYLIPIRTKAEQEAIAVAKREAQFDSGTGNGETLVIADTECTTPAKRSDGVAEGEARDTSLSALPPDEWIPTAYDELTEKQRTGARMLASLLDSSEKLSNEEICRRLHIQTETLRAWQRDPTFKQAVEEIGKPEFIMRLGIEARRDLLERFENGNCTKEDRQLAFKLLGYYTDANQMNVSATFLNPWAPSFKK